MKNSPFKKAFDAYIDEQLKLDNEYSVTAMQSATVIEEPYTCCHCGCHLYDDGTSVCPNCDEAL